MDGWEWNGCLSLSANQQAAPFLVLLFWCSSTTGYQKKKLGSQGRIHEAQGGIVHKIKLPLPIVNKFFEVLSAERQNLHHPSYSSWLVSSADVSASVSRPPRHRGRQTDGRSVEGRAARSCLTRGKCERTISSH